jgi:dephospho-CoA kinase
LKIEEAQFSQEKKINQSDFVVNTDQNFEDTKKELLDIVKFIKLQV